jgi:hypothetical protein
LLNEFANAPEYIPASIPANIVSGKFSIARE